MANIRWLKLDKNDKEMIYLVKEKKIGEIKNVSGEVFVGIETTKRKNTKKHKYIVPSKIFSEKNNDENIRQYCAIVKKGFY